MSEQDSIEQSQEPVADQGVSDATTQEAQSAEGEIMARLSKLEAENTKLRQESASRRVKAKEANDARQAALEENNQFKELSEHLKHENDRLKGLEGAANSWLTFQEKEVARIESACESLPDNLKSAVLSIPDIVARSNALEAFTATGSPSKPPPQAAPAAPKASVDFSMAGNDPALLKQLIRDNPDQWDEYIGKKSNTGNGTFIGRALNRGN